MTGSRLGRYAETGQPPGFGGVGGARPLSLGAHGALRPYFPESLTRKSYRKKIPEMTLNVPHVPPGTAHSLKISGTCPVRCPFLFRTIVKRHAMTGSGLGCYARPGQPPGFGGDGWGHVSEKSKKPFMRTKKNGQVPGCFTGL